MAKLAQLTSVITAHVQLINFYSYYIKLETMATGASTEQASKEELVGNVCNYTSQASGSVVPKKGNLIFDATFECGM